MKKLLCTILSLVVLLSDLSPCTFAKTLSEPKKIEQIKPLAKAEEMDTEKIEVISDPDGDTFEEILLNAIRNRVDEVNVSKLNMPVEDLAYALKEVEYRNPMDYYWTVEEYRSTSDETKVWSVRIIYTYTVDEVARWNRYIEKHVNRVLELMPEGLSDLSKALWLHDYLVNAFNYDFSVYEDERNASREIVSMIKTGVGVCEAYVKTYSVFLNKLGIQNSFEYHSGINHVWNTVKINGKWYNVDITNDDGNGSYNIHEYFMLSDEAYCRKRGCSATPYKDYACTDTTYDNFFVHSIRNSAGVYGEYVYYCDNTDLNMLKNKITNINGSEAVSFITFDKWSYFEPNKSWGKNCFTSAMTYRDKLVYCTEKEIKSYDFTSGETEVLLTSSESLYGVYMGYSMDDAMLTYFEGRLLDGGSREFVSVKELVLEKGILLGDANGDGFIDTADASAILKYILKEGTLNEKAADCNRDGAVDTADATSILKYILNEFEII